MKTEMVKAKLNGKWELILPKHRADRPEWYTKHGWEKARLESMEHHLRMDRGGKDGWIDQTIYYIGAEEGEMVALCQMWGAKVVMFEPNPKAWSHIRSIWEANKLDMPAGIYPGFASDRTEKAARNDYTDDLTVSDDGWPICSQYEMEAAHGFKELDKESRTFDQMRIDDYVIETGIIPTAISLDVEGAEGLVLRGSEGTLRKYHPKIWLSGHPEFLHDNFEHAGGFEYLRDLRDWLKEDLGYTEDILAYDHEVHLYYHL